jgi:DNA-binding protein H-NS
MSLEDLKRLKRELDKAIANYDDRRKAEARRDS